MLHRFAAPSALLLIATLALLACALPSSALNQISVKSYGAVGDGVHDDTAALNAALASLLERAQPGVSNELYFPAATYLLGSTPTNPNGYFSLIPEENMSYSMVGDGSSTTTILWRPAYGTLLDLQPNEHSIPIVSNTIPGSSFTLSGLNISWPNSFESQQITLAQIQWYAQTNFNDVAFNGADPYDYGVAAIQISGDSDGSLAISDVSVTGCAIFLSSTNLSSITVSETTMMNVDTGISVTTTGAQSNLVIDSLMQTNVPVGVYVTMDGNDQDPNNVIQNARITNSQFLITSNLSGGPANEAIIHSSIGQLYVEGCTFSDTIYQTRNHINPKNGVSVTLIDNTFNAGSYGIYSDAGTDGDFYPAGSFDVTGNTFNGPWSSFGNIAFDTASSGSVSVENNNCNGVGTYLYHCGSGQTCVLSNNAGCTQAPKKKMTLV